MNWTLYPEKKGDPDSPALKACLLPGVDLREMIILSEDEDGLIDRFRWKPKEKKVKPVKESRPIRSTNVDNDLVI